MSTKITRGARQHLIKMIELIRREHKYGVALRGRYSHGAPPRHRLHLWRKIKVAP